MSAAILPARSAPAGPRRPTSWRRWSLWTLLGVLVLALLVTLVWLAARYEASLAQSNVERDAADALSDIRSALVRNVQDLQALQAGHPAAEQWQLQADQLLRTNREWVRIEWRGPRTEILWAADTPFRP
ncbi:MAG TPA: PAS domain-containing sensor histidine kinase, partial [Ramlibacter sp.]